MLNLKVRKQTRSEASKNKVITKRVSNISINWVNLNKYQSNKFLNITKRQITKKSRNSKLKEKGGQKENWKTGDPHLLSTF